MRTLASSAVVVLLLAGSAPGQTILGNQLDIKEKPGFPFSRSVSVKAQESLSPDLIDGDPATNGAVIQIIVTGATSTTQTITLPAGTRWRRAPRDVNLPATGWRYKESALLGYVSPVVQLGWAKSSSGKFKLLATFSGRRLPLDVAVPNPGTYAGLVLSIPGGATYCVNFGGDVGGTIYRNDVTRFRIAKPPVEGVCPSGTPVCGDGVVDSPSETCDGTNDSACPGLCGVNGLPCLCPICGDNVVDPGESCDGQTNLGSCTEGCSRQCTCTVCGDGLTQYPAEECEPSDPDSCNGTGMCYPVGSPYQCSCPFCGDGAVNAPGEQCEAGDDAACPGLCVTSSCTCPVCGNGDVEPGEECDDSSSPCGAGGGCLANCTCSHCGDGVIQGEEQCEVGDDSPCPGHCVTDACYCAVCGDGSRDAPVEQCDGPDDATCPDACQPDCTCP